MSTNYSLKNNKINAKLIRKNMTDVSVQEILMEKHAIINSKFTVRLKLLIPLVRI